MPATPLVAALRHFIADEDALRRLAAGEAAALELLARRHGPLVWRVCRRVAADHHAAEDAYQATFLVLARRAAAVRKPASLASWLHGVAYRLATRARRTPRAALPELAASGAGPEQAAAARELGRLVEAEVARLPEPLRLPVLLCYWDGLTNEEAAQRLGWPVGTVKTRLAAARQRLHDALSSRGVALPAGVVALLLAPGNGEAAPPLTATTSATALARRYGPSVLGWKLAASLAILLAVLTAGAAALLHADPPGLPLHPATAKLPMPQPPANDAEPLPPGALLRLGTLRFRHQGPVMHVAFSPDGGTVASASLDGTVRLWDAATGKERHRAEFLVSQPSFPWFGGSFAFAPDGKTLALARYGAGFWDTATGKEVAPFKLPVGQNDRVLCVQYCKDGRVLAAVATDDATVLRVLDAGTGKEVLSLKSRGRVEFALVAPDGKAVAVGDISNQGEEAFRLIDLATGKERAAPALGKDRVLSAAYTADAATLALSTGKTIRLFDVATGKAVRAWDTEYSGVVAFSPDGKRVAAGDNETVHVWDATTGKSIASFPCFQWVQSVAFSPDGTRLAAGTGSHFHRYHPLDDSGGGPVHVWDLTTQKRIGPADSHQDGVLCVATTKGLIASGSRDHTVRLWDAKTGRPLAVLTGHQHRVVGLAFSHDGKLLASASVDRTVKLWDTATHKEVATLQHGAPVHAVAFSPDGTLLAAAASTNAVLWDVARRQTVKDWPLETGTVCAVAFAPDGKTLAWAGGQRVYLPDAGDNGIRLVDVASRKVTKVLPKQPGFMAVCALAFSPDGTLAAGYMNTRLLLWLPGKDEPAHSVQTRAEGSVAFAPDGKMLLTTGGLAATVYVYETITGKERCHFDSPQGRVQAAAFTADGRAVVTAGEDTTLLVWDLTRPPR